jgi:hypothetical protein
LGFFLAEKIYSHKKPQERRSREARYLSIPRLSITAAILLHRVSSGRDGERLADVGGVVDFVGRFILMRLMNPSAIIKVEVSGQPGLRAGSGFSDRCDFMKLSWLVLLMSSIARSRCGVMPCSISIYHWNLSSKRTNKQHFSEIQRWRFGDRFSGGPPGRSTGRHRSSRSFSPPP